MTAKFAYDNVLRHLSNGSTLPRNLVHKNTTRLSMKQSIDAAMLRINSHPSIDAYLDLLCAKAIFAISTGHNGVALTNASYAICAWAEIAMISYIACRRDGNEPIDKFVRVEPDMKQMEPFDDKEVS